MKLKRMFYLLLILLYTSTNGQPYKNIVFEGAGVRGIAFVGAIKELEVENIISNIENIGGTSAGTIAALTLSLGYNSEDIEKIIYNTKLQKFNDGKYIFFGGIARMNRNYGWYRGKAFNRWLEKIIVSKTGNADITFREMHERNFKDLYVTGTSLNHQKLIIFSNETYPDMKVKDAVRISMSIPLYFEAVLIDATGHVISNQPKGYYDIMVDGGFTGNFPIFIFDSLVQHSNGQASRYANINTIGLRIDTPEQIAYDKEENGLAPIEINRFNDYVIAFYNYVIENLNRNTLTPTDWQRTVSISSGDIGPKIKRLSLAEKETLINNGQSAMRNFLMQSVNSTQTKQVN